MKNFTYGPMIIHNDIKLVNEVLKNCSPERIVRDKGTTSKFYSYNHEIVRIDFTNRCKNIKYVKEIK